MRRAASGLLAIAFAATFIQSPWLHVHESTAGSDHYEAQHVGLGIVHGHGHDGEGPEWRQTDADDDAHFLGPIKGIGASPAVFVFLRRPAFASAQPVLDPVGRHVELVPTAHGPPDLSAIPPRAPPA